MLRTTFIWSIQLRPTVYLRIGCHSASALAKIPPFVRHVRASLPLGPYCSRELQCHYWYQWSCGPTRLLQRPPGPHLRQRFLRLLRCRWWWNQRQSWLCAGNDQSCLWWCLGHLLHQWFRGNSQSAGCPSLVWRDAGLQGHIKINTPMYRVWHNIYLFSTYFMKNSVVLHLLWFELLVDQLLPTYCFLQCITFSHGKTKVGLKLMW